jgi:Spy/CpxP family protein refolding chaperone
VREWPASRSGLDRAAVMAYSAELYDLDGQLAYDRARVSGAVIRSLDGQQRAALSALKFGDSRTWPDQPPQLDRRGMPHDVNVAMMTYASEFFSWYAGSLDADTYFCPERHGMYFGGFGMKTAPAMGKRDYSISTALTGDAGEAFLQALTPTQRAAITGVIERQRADLAEIAKIRREISTELRRLWTQPQADVAKVRQLSRRYGELDGELSYWYATAFAAVGQTLTAAQRSQLGSLRDTNPNDPRGPFIYSSPQPGMRVANSDFLFGTAK